MTETSMMAEISAELFSGINGASMGLFETGFRIFISAIIISESAFDLGYLISQTEVQTTLVESQLRITFYVFNMIRSLYEVYVL